MSQSLSIKPRFLRSPEDFEAAAADWLRAWGFKNVCLTPQGADGGIDVESTEAVVQVKAWMVPIGSPDVQRLKGAAFDGRQAIFFSLSDYTEAAKIFARKAGVALFRFTGYNGEIEPINSHSQLLLKSVHSQDERVAVGLPIAESNPAITLLVQQTLDKIINWGSGYAVFDVSASSRYVQLSFDSWDLVIESVGPEYINEQNALTKLEENLLTELGWPPLSESNYQLLFEQGELPKEQIVEILASTLTLVHHSKEVGDITVTCEQHFPD